MPLVEPLTTPAVSDLAASNPEVTRHLQLLRALRIVIRADSDPARQALFANLMRSSRPVRLAHGLHRRLHGTWAATLLVGGFGLASFLNVAPPRSGRARVLAVALHVNAKRQVARVFEWMGPGECALLRSGFTAIGLSAVGRLLWRGRLGTALRVVRMIDRRHGFLVSCRAIAALAWYARTKSILAVRAPGAVLVSSDSNPEEVGFAAAARVLRIPQVFVSHAYPTPFSPPLEFSVSILEGEEAVRTRRRKGPVRGAVLLAGIEGESAPLDPRRFLKPNPVIGIFTPKGVSWPTLAAVIDDCRRHSRSSRIVIRWHPSMFEPPHLGEVVADLSAIVESPRGAKLPDVARQCDWVIADENSNVHLPVLKLGIPTVAVSKLGLYPSSRLDMYGFIANRIVFPAVASIRDIHADEFLQFFSDGWAGRFAQYDASYLRPKAEIGGEVGRAIRALYEESRSKATST